MADLEALIRACEEKLRITNDIESILSYLRENSCSKIDCIKVLMRVKQLSLNEAKELVHMSRTWSDVRESDEALHDEIVKSLETDK